jgi:hypothetical protein
MNNEENAPIILILGAGASKAFNIPDIKDFYEEFKRELARRKISTSLIEKLEQYHKSEVNLETLIAYLRNLKSAVDTMTGVGSVPQDLVRYADEAKILHDFLMRFIIVRCEKFDEQRAVRSYRSILELCNKVPIWFFTTNYDRIIEYCSEMCNMEFSDGFVKQGEGFYLWKDKFDTNLRIAKIHGSVNWFRDEESDTIVKLEEPHPFPTSEFRIRYGSYNFSTSIIIPTFEKYISELPFFSLQTRLIDAMRKAKICFVIGTRLHDSHIRNILLTNLEKIIVITVSLSPDSIQTMFNNHPNMLTIKSGFEDFTLASTGYVEELIQSLSSGDAREAAKSFVNKITETLANLGRSRTIEGGPIDELLTRLRSLNYIERADSARRLGEAGVKRSIPELLPLLKDSNEYVRIQTVSALGLLQAQDALSRFRDLLLSDESEDVKVEVVLALREIKNQEAMAILKEAPNMPNLSRRIQSILTDSVN